MEPNNCTKALNDALPANFQHHLDHDGFAFKPQYKLHSHWKRKAKPLLTLMICALFFFFFFSFAHTKSRQTIFCYKIHYSYYRAEVGNKICHVILNYNCIVRKVFWTTMRLSFAAIWLAMNGSMQQQTHTHTTANHNRHIIKNRAQVLCIYFCIKCGDTTR